MFAMIKILYNAACSDTVIVKSLLSAGADPKVSWLFGGHEYTPLSYVVMAYHYHSRPHLVQNAILLLAAGANRKDLIGVIREPVMVFERKVAKIQAAFRSWLWRKEILWNPYSDIGARYLRVQAMHACNA